MKGGTKTDGRDLFPEGMSRAQVEGVIREAYRHAKKVHTNQTDKWKLQGEADGMVIEMWLSKDTHMIETAYPTKRDRR